MLRNRIIPCLLLENHKLVKTKQFKDPKYVGDPINAIKIFNEKEVDEIIVLDIFATKQKREPDFKFIENLASECFMPLCYGGGITKFEHAKILFSIGVEKISIQNAAFENINFIKELADKFGSQAIVASVDIKKNLLGNTILHSYNSLKNKVNWLEWIKTLTDSGAGEILLNSIDHDGMMNGMNLKAIKTVSTSMNFPLISIGGVGSNEHIIAGIEAGASAISAGSFFVFHGPHRAVLITYPHYEEFNFKI
jgi:cyclase